MRSEEEQKNMLQVAVSEYKEHKGLADYYKDMVETEGKEIKALMKVLGLTEFDGIKKVVSHRYSINEDKLLGVIKQHEVAGLIKTKEYVDMDALEDFLYHMPAGSEAFVADVARCKTDTEVVQLRISKKKGE